MHQKSQDDHLEQLHSISPSSSPTSPPCTSMPPRKYPRGYSHSAHPDPPDSSSSAMKPYTKRVSPFSKPQPPPLRTLFIKILVVLLTAFFFLSTVSHDQPWLKKIVKLPRASPAPKDFCHLVAVNPDASDLWQFNTRTLCVMSHVCVSNGSVYHSSDFEETQCQVSSPAFEDRHYSFPAYIDWMNRSCSMFEHDNILREHGPGMRDWGAEWPKVESLQTAERLWMEGVSIVVPHYPWPWNIFHYINVVSDLFRAVHHLDVLLDRWGRDNLHDGDTGALLRRVNQVNVVFQGPRVIPYKNSRWQREVLNLVRKRMEQKYKVAFYHLEDIGTACMRNAILLGRRGHDNVWPFLNETNMPLDGLSVPKDAVDFKQMAYEGLGISSKLPDRGISDPPPFVLGYAKRVGKPHTDGFYRWGSSRRFSEENEKWFGDMLERETKAVGAKLVTVMVDSNDNLQKQVQKYTDVGFLVGIHGANLVNSIFMHPFGALMEMIPFNVTARCYMGGLNSGLKYLRFDSDEPVSKEVAGCDPKDIECDFRNRLVGISESESRAQVQGMVKDGLKHLQRIRAKYRGGVRVHYNEQSLHYEVVGL